MNKTEIMAHHSREMRDGKAYCFVDGTTELLYDDAEATAPVNGFRCEDCGNAVCDGCQYPTEPDLCIPCGEARVHYAEKHWSHA